MKKMKDMPWTDRTKKDIQRDIFLNNTKIRNASTAVFLPGIESVCVNKSYEKGIIGPDSFLILIEEEREILPAIRKNAEKLGYTVIDAKKWDGKSQPGVAVLYGTNTKNIDLSQIKIEFAFFDFIGNLTPEMQEFINRCGLADDAEITYTKALKWRNCGFPKEIKNKKFYRDAVAEIDKATYRKEYLSEWKGDYPDMDLNTVALNAATCRYSKEFIRSQVYHDSRCRMQITTIRIKSERTSTFWANLFTRFTGKSPEFHPQTIQEKKSLFSEGVSFALLTLNKLKSDVRSSDVSKFIQEFRGMSLRDRKEYAEIFHQKIGNFTPEITASDRIALRNLKKENLKKFGTRTLQIA